MTNDLKASIKGLSGQKKFAKLRAIMPEIEQKLAEGVTHEDIVRALYNAGFDIALPTFRMYLYRYRRIQKSPPEPEIVQKQVVAQPPQVAIADVADTVADFDTALDPRQRESASQKYMDRRPPIIGKKRNET